jgi:ubiquitin-protein ligase
VVLRLPREFLLTRFQEFPLLPPKMIFDSEMWHPNSAEQIAVEGGHALMF